MARNLKPGISFYRVDTGHIQNKKIRLLFNKFGAEGYYVWSCIIDYAYRECGYYFDMNDPEGMELFASEYCRIPLDRVLPIIENCIIRGLFDERIAREYKILTSAMMQDIFIHATQERRRKGSIFFIDENWVLFPEFEVLPKNLRILPRKNEEIPVNNTQIQDIRYKIQEEDILGQDAPATDKNDDIPVDEVQTTKKASRAPRPKFVAPDFNQVKAYFMGTAGNPANGNGYWPEDLCHNEANKFLDHYIANGWIQGKGKKIIDWEATCRNWIRNQKEGTFSNAPRPANKTYQAPAAPVVNHAPPALTKSQNELNYFFDWFRDDPSAVTIISIDPEHYNTLKSANLISFDDSQVAEIKAEAQKHIDDLKVENSESNLLRFMKKVGVLHFFKQYNREDRESIFNANK